MSNVLRVPFGDLSDETTTSVDPVNGFMEEVNDFCELNGVDTSTAEYRHKAAVIMTQLQVILRGL